MSSREINYTMEVIVTKIPYEVLAEEGKAGDGKTVEGIDTDENVPGDKTPQIPVLQRSYSAEQYSCTPLPIFIPLITAAEIGCFLWATWSTGVLLPSAQNESFFVYRTDKKAEFWRFVLYILLHTGWLHLFFNTSIQLLVGLPLEMTHGSTRVAVIYLAGVLAGSLGISVLHQDAVVLLGASGGVYALLASHLANIIKNFSEVELGPMKLAAVLIIMLADVTFTIWDRTKDASLNNPVLGYVAHLAGALAGLTVGLLVLKTFKKTTKTSRDRLIWWTAFGVYFGCMGFAVVWNFIY